MDLSLHDSNVMYCDNVIKNEVENTCETCKFCNLCIVHADNFAYVKNGRGIITHCNMYERIDNV